MNLHKSDGFSMVELIVVIVLLGIVGVVVIPRFIGPSSFEIASVQDGLISTIRAAQQAALGRDRFLDTVTFEVAGDLNGLQLLVNSDGNVLRTFDLPSDDLTLETGPADSDQTCASDFEVPIDEDSNFQLVFDKRGNLTQFRNDGVPGSPISVDDSFNGVRICVNDTNALSVCVSPAGYAYAGNCDA